MKDLSLQIRDAGCTLERKEINSVLNAISEIVAKHLEKKFLDLPTVAAEGPMKVVIEKALEKAHKIREEKDQPSKDTPRRKKWK